MLSRALFVAFALSTLLGCETFSSPAEQIDLEQDTPYWFKYSASRRGGFVAQRTETKIVDGTTVTSTTPFVISEPSPDVAFSSTIKVAAKVAEKGTLDSSVVQSIAQLGGRTETVLLLREAMYRLSEQSLINPEVAESAHVLYAFALETARQLALAEKKASAAAQTQALASVLEALHKIDAAQDPAVGTLNVSMLSSQILTALGAGGDDDDSGVEVLKEVMKAMGETTAP